MPTTEILPEAEDGVREEYFCSQATGVEFEEDVTASSEETDPWDPEKIRVHTKHYSLQQVVEMIDAGDIDIAPDLRRQAVWKPRQRSGLIESLLLSIPLPSFYFNDDRTGQLQVVDGVQRLTTIFKFVTERAFRLSQMAYLPELEGMGYGDMAMPFRRRLANSQFVVHVIDPVTPYWAKFDIFRRINTGGPPLSAQEIRHRMSNTRSRQFLNELVSNESFITATHGSLRGHPRMADREVALRFVAFRQFDTDGYAKHRGFDEFLGYVTNCLDDLEYENLDALRADFIRGMTNCYSVFGEHAFRKWPLNATRKNQINRALFDSWGTVLADYDETEVQRAAPDLVDRARSLMTNDIEFINSISGSTGDFGKVRIRFAKVRAVTDEVLG